MSNKGSSIILMVKRLNCLGFYLQRHLPTLPSLSLPAQNQSAFGVYAYSTSVELEHHNHGWPHTESYVGVAIGKFNPHRVLGLGT